MSYRYLFYSSSYDILRFGGKNMPWNWQIPEWPHFKYDPNRIQDLEKKFLINAGKGAVVLASLDPKEKRKFTVEILANEGLNSSSIEGEWLQRESLQSSVGKHFGFNPPRRESEKESAMADLLIEVYQNYALKLTHETFFKWHALLFQNDKKLESIGAYRVLTDPMQIVSNRYDNPKVYFEAPPSYQVPQEMDRFIEWFNSSKESLLGKVAIAHLYFESIHPFEDGNGRIGRALVEKSLSDGVQAPVLIAISDQIQKDKKKYYEELGRCNQSLEADEWVFYFSTIIIKAQEQSMKWLHFLIAKSKMFTQIMLNPRQEKVLLKMFSMGPEGFAGGLSAENYIAITKASRATATRDLQELIETGALYKTGQLRHTRYFLNLGEKF